MINFQDVTKKFGSTTALDKASFSVEKGEFVFINGPSGSGKTTIFKLILAQIKPTSGQIEVNGQNLSKMSNQGISMYRQKIGTVFQDFKVLSERTVSENIEIALAVIGLDSLKWDERIKHVLKLVGLSKHYNLFPSQLSGGEIQRLSLARALVVNPEIILADEPTGNLDIKTSLEIMELLEKVNKEGKTVIMVTHNQDIVKKLNKRVIEIIDGKIKQ